MIQQAAAMSISVHYKPPLKSMCWSLMNVNYFGHSEWRSYDHHDDEMNDARCRYDRAVRSVVTQITLTSLDARPTLATRDDVDRIFTPIADQSIAARTVDGARITWDNKEHEQ